MHSGLLSGRMSATQAAISPLAALLSGDVELIVAAAAHHAEERLRSVVAELARKEGTLTAQHLRAPVEGWAAALAVQILRLDKALTRRPASTGSGA